MKTLLCIVLTTAFAILGLSAFAPDPIDAIPPVSAARVRVKKTMKPFKSEQELNRYFQAYNEKERQRRAKQKDTDEVLAMSVTVVGAEPESVTNVQTAGVDEGGIVKLHGNHLVILRRGRLFTVAVGDGALKPISAVDAFGPTINPANNWYDEMLVSGDTIIVIGYSYGRGGTEVGLFDIDDDGRLSYRSTYHLRSNDYYSSRNYASRLIGNKLIFYSPLTYSYNDEPDDSLPAVRKWHKDATPKDFRRITPATRVYKPETELDFEWGMTLHTVTTCDLSRGGFDCQATSVIGNSGHVFYVSKDAVYVWTSSWDSNGIHKHVVFRMPFDGSAPSALRAAGGPIDQFSFLESDDQYLNVLVTSQAKGDGMWRAEMTDGDVALVRIPIASFSDGSEAIPDSSYRPLEKPIGYTYQNRFVGDYLIYGTGSSWAPPQNGRDWQLHLVNWRGGNSHKLTLPHGVDRIEQLGSDAVIVGTDGRNLHFTSVKLSSWPEVISRYTRKEASQGELRSHGFFYKPQDTYSGTLGLPISTPGRPGYKHLFEDSASILFLRNDSLHFREVGELGSEPDKAIDDHCRASCVDWYGNARPLFVRGRVFALLGYELVEGTMETGRMREIRRVNFAPDKETTRGE